MDQSKFRQRVEDKREDLIFLTQDLIKIPTVNPPESFIRIALSISTNDSNLRVLILRSFELGTPGVRAKTSSPISAMARTLRPL